MSVGILALQGDYQKHRDMLSSLGVSSFFVRTAADLNAAEALVLPGGESTVMTRLLKQFGLWDELKRKVRSGLPVMGTCAGLILLSSSILSHRQSSLGGMDIQVVRNSYGSQIASFQEEISVPILGKDGEETFPGIFIRAPLVRSFGDRVEVLASRGAEPVLLRQGAVLGMSFHPELTEDSRIHKLFLESF